MKTSESNLDLLPPRLSMDEYVEFVARSLQDCNPQSAIRQKELEERIERPFSMSDQSIPSARYQAAVRRKPSSRSTAGR